MNEAHFVNKCSIGKYTCVNFPMLREIFVSKFAVFHEFQLTIFTLEFDKIFLLNPLPAIPKVGSYRIICTSNHMFRRGLKGKLPECIFENSPEPNMLLLVNHTKLINTLY